ncbi:hypothetical protein N0V86_000919 [Didymella sp. IMI 355093]|nr:hypothetical protein N0V86_000919 [Didymella sp. IMI 355093]
MAAEDEVPADVDEPPEHGRTPRPAPLKIQHSSSFTKISSKPGIDRKTSLLTSALQSASNTNSPVDDHSDRDPPRGMSCISTWSNSTISTAGLTSDEGFTSPGTRACTPSPPLPSTMIHTMLPPLTQKPLEQRLKFVGQENDTVAASKPTKPAGEQGVEATLGRKRCIMFACGGKKEEKKPVEAPAKPTTPLPAEEPPKRACTIKFACAKPTIPAIAAEEPAKRPSTIKFACPAPKASKEVVSKPRTHRRPASPAPPPRRIPVSPKPSPRAHRGSDSTVRNNSPISVRKVSMVDRTRRLSQNSELARTEAYRFHEFASSEEEVEEWTQEITCHRNRLTVGDTLRVENNLRQLVEEAEEEALEDDDDDDDDAADDEDDDEDEDEDEDDGNSDAYSDATDEGFQTDDEEGFAVSDDESDAGSDYNWWAPGGSTAATSIDHIGNLRPKNHRTVSESSIGSLESRKNGLKMFEREHGQRAEAPSGHSVKRKKSKPVNIRAPEPELPDSTDFVCGTLDEDRPAEEAYMSNLERRRAAKHKPAPQDIDPSFPASDPELVEDEEEDEVDDIENPSESDNYFMMQGRMDIVDGAPRGRRRDTLKQRSPPAHSPKRLRSPAPVKRTVHRSPPPPITKRTSNRSPPPPTKKTVRRSPPPPITKRSSNRSPPPPIKKAIHRSPPPSRTLFGKSPVRARSPAPIRLRSPPPSLRGSANIMAARQRSEMSIKFGGIGERQALTVSASLPRTPITAHHNPLEYDDDDDDVTSTNDMPVRRAIDIQVGLEKKRQRRREQLYRKQHRKSTKEKRPPVPGRGAERMRDVGLQMAAHKGKTTAFNPFYVPATPDQANMHVLSV